MSLYSLSIFCTAINISNSSLASASSLANGSILACFSSSIRSYVVFMRITTFLSEIPGFERVLLMWLLLTLGFSTYSTSVPTSSTFLSEHVFWLLWLSPVPVRSNEVRRERFFTDPSQNENSSYD